MTIRHRLEKLLTVSPVLVVLATLLGLPATSQAVAIYDGEVTLSVTLEGVNDAQGNPFTELDQIFVVGDAEFWNSGSWAEPGDIANQTGQADFDSSGQFGMLVGDSISLSAGVSGQSSSGMAASSIAQTDGSIYLENTFSGEFEFFFSYEASYKVNAGTDGLPGEYAFSEIWAAIVTGVPGYSSDVIHLDEYFVVDTGFGDPPVDDSFSGTFSLRLAPGEIDLVYLLADAQGEALGTIPTTSAPEPGTLVLVVFGLFYAARRNTVRL